MTELGTRVGQDIGTSSWIAVDQQRIDEFAHCTGDHQWIHVDVERAKDSPFGGTIAHGYYTLSIAPRLLGEVLPLDRYAMAVNYGLERLRFPAPLPVGDSVRMRVRLDRVDDFPGGATLTLTLTFERQGGVKPVSERA